MIKIFRVTAALALLAASLPALAASATVTRAWQYKPEAAGGLTLRNFVGDIRVEPGTAPGFHVTAQATVEADSQAEAERLAGLVDFRTKDSGAASRFEVRLPPAHFPKVYWSGGAEHWWSSSYAEYLGERIRLSGRRDDSVEVRVDLLIRAPAGAKLDAGTMFGNGSSRSFSGELRLDSSSGTLTSTDGEGRVVLDSGSGAVTVTGHRGEVVADTGSGPVTITDCECAIEADTGSGAVEVRDGKGSISADTGSGRVSVQDFSGSLTADTGSGAVRGRSLTDVERLEVDTGSGSVTIEGDLSAMTRLEIDTGSGSVDLRSSARPSMEIRIDTGSGGVDIHAPGAAISDSEGVRRLRLGDGAGRGDIDTGSGSVDLHFP